MVRLKQRRAIPALGVEEGVLPTGVEADPVGQIVGLAVDVPEQVWVVLLARDLEEGEGGGRRKGVSQ
jgi:hypothetical protein